MGGIAAENGLHEEAIKQNPDLNSYFTGFASRVRFTIHLVINWLRTGMCFCTVTWSHRNRKEPVKLKQLNVQWTFFFFLTQFVYNK